MAESWSAVPEWMAKAEGDWEALEIFLSRDSPRLRDSVVFHAQQCVEKLLKARLGTYQRCCPLEVPALSTFSQFTAFCFSWATS